MPDAPTEIADVLLAQEIRAHIAKQKDTDLIDYLLRTNNKTDIRLVSAVLHAPSYLSGLTDEHKNLFIREAEIALFPGAAGSRCRLKKAFDQMQEAFRKPNA